MNEIILTGDNTLTRQSENEIAKLWNEITELQKKQEEVKALLREEMFKRGIVKIDSDKLIINYVSPTSKETFQTKEFRKDHPDLYDEYVKITPVKEYVKVVAK